MKAAPQATAAETSLRDLTDKANGSVYSASETALVLETIARICGDFDSDISNDDLRLVIVGMELISKRLREDLSAATAAIDAMWTRAKEGGAQ